MKGGFMRLKEFQYVKSLISDIFYDSSGLKDEEIQEVYNVMQDKQMLLRCLSFTRSTKRNFLHEPLKKLKIPTLIIWGRQDQVTPTFVAEEFLSHIEGSKLFYLDHCGHVPCFEKPDQCYQLITDFLKVPPEVTSRGR
jgi:pimeloyl-ACP methyl ester carboxylesterase